MKTIAQTNQLVIEKKENKYKKLNNHFVKPTQAGLRGFVTILLLIFFIHLVSYVLGNNKKLGLDFIDLQLAGMGFLLQLSKNVIQNLRR